MQEDVGAPVPVMAVPLSARQRFAASLAISFVLYTSLLMASPYTSLDPAVRTLLRPAVPLLDNLGLSHRLRLFAPSPPRRSRYLAFKVRFSDGTSRDWDYPRSVLVPGDPPNSYNRLLVIYAVWASRDPRQALLTDLARYVAFENAEPERQPVSVDIVERWAKIPPPEEGVGKPLVPPDQEAVLIHYDAQKDQTTAGPRPTAW